ncbi:hypothetical protein H4R99_006690 [Coemansia sp. RSA 1722]|nr:hypothetical protein LPJ57_002172 [Coemansia sp. RSA 486]KAJ2233783.1 hypothetical protein IWW45_003911 [Coemansia sp. RSA 485]KAJ2591611.1 hypothetical protein H4R99_006690 [Coemansia sp. RSA 1722]KAJ2634381.1 hypothetical protein GGF40_004234 [Coemansia sp. RSA 1286]KAJ2702121.1 hypothetical protein FB645_004403 [Coemansia sp. IMI 203386]
MKYMILTLAVPAALGSLVSEEFKQTQSTSRAGLFDYFAPASSSGVSQLCQGDCQNDGNVPQTSASVYMSAQCQGDCQNDDAAAPNAENQNDVDPVGIRGLVRQFVGPQRTSPSIDAMASGHLVLYNTPVYDMVYNYMFSPEDASAQPTQVNRYASMEVAGDAVIDDIRPVSSAASSRVALGSEMEDFDFSSWGRRVDNAAQRLVSNVEAVIVRYLSRTQQQLSTPTAAADEYAEEQQENAYENSVSAALSAADRFQWY